VMVGCTASTTKAGRHRDDLDSSSCGLSGPRISRSDPTKTGQPVCGCRPSARPRQFPGLLAAFDGYRT
jgi:hypothetical protein